MLSYVWKTGVFELTRNFNTSRHGFALSKNPSLPSCVTVPTSLIGTGDAVQMLRFLPQDFHNCGKHCGKREWLSKISQIIRFLGPSWVPSPARMVNFRVFIVVQVPRARLA